MDSDCIADSEILKFIYLKFHAITTASYVLPESKLKLLNCTHLIPIFKKVRMNLH